MWMFLTGAAFAYEPPNSTLGVSVGTPWLVGGRGEAWFADELSAELGAGTRGAVGDGFGLDATVRWRPDILCLGCDYRAAVSFGVGLATLVEPDPGFDGPWAFAVGPDLVGTFVYWFSPTYGLALSARGGIGAGWVGEDIEAFAPRPWAWGTVGLAF